MRNKSVPSNYISISQLAQKLMVSNNTIKRWYMWWEDDSYEKPTDLNLPEYYIFDRKGTKYFNVDDIDKFRDFQASVNTIHRGCMVQFNKEKVFYRKEMD